MTARKRVLALAIAVIASALTVMGIVIAATDPNPGDIGKDPLTLNGYPPRTANLEVTLSTTGGVGLSANVTINFTKNRASAVVSFPTAISTSAVSVTMANDHLYARSAEVSNGPWYDTPFTSPSLFGVSLELTRPDIDLISGFHRSVSKSGYLTTYVFTRQHVALSHLVGSTKSFSTLGSVRWSVTVGSQDEATASTLVISSKHSTTTISAKVLSYNQPAAISIPSAHDLQAMPLSSLEKLLKGKDFASLLIPRDLTSLSQTSLS